MIPSNRTLWLKLSFIVTLSLSALLLPRIQPLDTAFFLSLFSHLLKGWIDQHPMKAGPWNIAWKLPGT